MSRPRTRTLRKSVARAGTYAGVALGTGLLSLVFLLPFLLMIIGALRDHVDLILRGPLSLPSTWRFRNFTVALTEYQFARYFFNTAVVTLPTVAGALVLGIMAAYALAFMQVPLGRWLLALVIAPGVMVAEEFIMIPLYQTMAWLDLVDTYTGVILPQLAMSASFCTLVFRAFFLGLPKELLDAATIDGASGWTALWRILWPVARPAAVAGGALVGIWTWNSYIVPLVLLPTMRKATLPLGLVFFQSQYTANIPLIMAGTAISAVPTIIAYVMTQGQIVRGLTAGAVH